MVFKSFYCIFIISRGENNRRRLLHQLQHFKAIDLWHLYIQENEIGMMLHDGLYTFKAIVAFLHQLDLRMTQQIFFNNGARQWFVVYDYCPDHTWGIFIVVVNILFSAFVVSRSLRENSRYRRRCTELNPKPVPCLGDAVSG